MGRWWSATVLTATAVLVLALSLAGGDASAKGKAKDAPLDLNPPGASSCPVGTRELDFNNNCNYTVWLGSAGGAVTCDRDDLRSAFPKAGRRIAVFLHGLGETPEAWRRRRRSTFGARLHRDFRMTAVYVAYNTGLHINDNGARLSELLEALVLNWPVRVEQLVLVGHSMGGLVARSACHAGIAGRRSWPARTTHLFTLGSPHMGVPLEKAVHAAARALRSVPESAPLADVIDRRSAGIRDLRKGYAADGAVGCVQTFISASRFSNAVGWLAGDLLVRSESATGRRSDGSVVVSSDHVFHLPALTHFDLLDHPLVYKAMKDIIAA